MLILTRRPRETVMIGDDVRVTVLRISRDQVQIGIAAPKDIPVHREEIYERINAKRITDGQIAEGDANNSVD